MHYAPILATLGYVLSKDRSRVLLIHRNARADDLHLGKYNGLGGKLAPNEDVAACMAREIREEAGIEVTQMALRGTISWPGFGKNGEDWFGFIFVVTQWTGEVLAGNDEGELEWIAREALLNGEVPLWEGDKHFLPMVFDDDVTQFHGVMPYKNGAPVSWNFTRS